MQAITIQERKTIFPEKIFRLIEWFSSDPRHYQIVFLFIFFLYGMIGLNWEVSEANTLLTFFTCLISQAVFTGLTTQDYRSLKSALISSLSLCLMLKTNDSIVIVLASLLTIASKFLLSEKTFLIALNLFQHSYNLREIQGQVRNDKRKNPKHFFNPTNFGIIATILLTHNAWISPGQWGNNGILVFTIGVFGLLVLLRVNRLDTALAFLLTFCALNFFRTVILLGWRMDFFLHQFTSGTLLLFAFFMITDPVSTPSHPKARIIWATMIGTLTFYLSNYQFVNGAPLWALFFLSPLTILLDKIFVHTKFSWL